MSPLRIASVVLGITCAGCGGSASETPWPMEPIDVEPGPVGEKAPSGDATDVDTAPVVEPPDGSGDDESGDLDEEAADGERGGDEERPEPE